MIGLLRAIGTESIENKAVSAGLYIEYGRFSKAVIRPCLIDREYVHQRSKIFKMNMNVPGVIADAGERRCRAVLFKIEALGAESTDHIFHQERREAADPDIVDHGKGKTLTGKFQLVNNDVAEGAAGMLVAAIVQDLRLQRLSAFR
jgi:hypothetical protein